ncbi:SigE family RNA polymerase sigma factor [Kribbella sandramycini]|uniref:RNA polymerase sigma-70 factor (Sigma-E family) n=1 Tax=Kribbella sandramycini TaxID=60450 RepID=A0A7Y4KZX3_9ACTN|nr:RNA polymerase sigma-70 factor (sigma-E family) [Kribbella sandramycini]NOL41758.1 SigE family RNA polymerase sigma factor [Kribbella sandramycini]
MSDRETEFLEYVTAHRGRMLRTARLLASGDAHWAEDLVQVALTRLYVHWAKVRREEGAERYADRILINAFLDERRRMWRRRESSTEHMYDAAPPSGADPAERLTVLDALGKLPRRQHAVVVLRYFRDFDVRTTAELMGCTEGTVKSQTSRALATMRDLLHDSLETLESLR